MIIITEKFLPIKITWYNHMTYFFNARKTALSLLAGSIIHSGYSLAASPTSSVLPLQNAEEINSTSLPNKVTTNSNSENVTEKKATNDDIMIVTAKPEERLKQQPGASLITQKDIERDPPVNDLSEIIRKMPGVNLTGNSATGSRGNNRQIDIRGMKPENTLILIDGVPVSSRSSVRYSRTGERDTRGDSNWVPPEIVDHIDVLRGPAAAQCGYNDVVLIESIG